MTMRKPGNGNPGDTKAEHRGRAPENGRNLPRPERITPEDWDDWTDSADTVLFTDRFARTGGTAEEYEHTYSLSEPCPICRRPTCDRYGD